MPNSDTDSPDVMDSVRVLIVDDQKTMRSILRDLLRQENITVVDEAADGEEALQFFVASDMDNPDVVICDLHMSGMDGMEFVHRMRRNKDMTPILILTGDSDEFLLEVTEQAGATRVLQKPISAEDLGREVRTAVGFG